MQKKKGRKLKIVKGKCIDCGKEIRIGSTRCRSCNSKGELSEMWKGDDARLPAIHCWVRSRKPKPKLCECCNTNVPYDLANISGEYHRDVNDFEWLCRKCHMRKDGRAQAVLRNLKQFPLVCFKCRKEIDRMSNYLQMTTHNIGQPIELVYFHLPSCWQQFNQDKVTQRLQQTLSMGVDMMKQGGLVA